MHIPHVDELKLWFGGVPSFTTDNLKPSDIAKELYRHYGDGVGRIEMKRGFVIVSFSKKTMNAILRETEGGNRLHMCGERWSVMKFDKKQAGPAPATRARRSRSRSLRKSKSRSASRRRSMSSCGSSDSTAPRDLLNDLFSSKAGSGLNKETLVHKLSTLSVKSQMQAIKIYRESDISAIRNPMGWFSSIIRTISLGLNHGGCPTAAGYNRPIPQYKPHRSSSRQRERSLSLDERRSRQRSLGSSPVRNRRPSPPRNRRSPPRNRRSPSRHRRIPSREQHRNFKRWSPYIRRLGPNTDSVRDCVEKSTSPASPIRRQFSLSKSRSSKPDRARGRSRSLSKRSGSASSARSASRRSVRSAAKR
eukprot:GEMP01047313.1.p1 GENE.GEMP01047313.1~~GEMP01047313.1.p1  ORF type:complete len:362 (+),score=50.35 GEMP01047313.1:214-1299(+)